MNTHTHTHVLTYTHTVIHSLLARVVLLFHKQEYVAVWSGEKMVVYATTQGKSLTRVAGES